VSWIGSVLACIEVISPAKGPDSLVLNSRVVPVAVAAGAVEQGRTFPLPQGEDDALEGYQSPITLCADESCLDTSELEQAAKRYQMVNIKLDKTGGLTEALNLAWRAKEKGMTLMIGNMTGTSLAMAPAYVVAQLCDFVDLDRALFLAGDRSYPMSYERGVVTGLSSQLWS